ncbi:MULTISPECIES: response regulator transcription factor [Thiothrix]|jgi:two-component system OmpR family response regulator|uniref:Response regulator transcription factor n=2 Tax=Thiothrix TaxID=1030 RepID=A0A975F975_9GAMM|nr:MULTISPECIES: response regulator transcription factor [Thiothrix]MDX9989987.1 response regulator transcription factor [Thiothrix unzii]QTR51312.1 response regulator transcription factor [Candidatus Thiothrix anitrata]QTR53592.1 response regulator transcription factor [Thiothrix unzii]
MNKHILIADDDPHIRDVISFALEKAGMQPTLAEDGRQALDLFRAQAADLIVLDINMPELDGLEVCREVRKFSDVPILFLSSRDDEIDRILGLEIGGDDYVTKPFSPRELVARINVILKRSQQLTPSSAAITPGELRLSKLTIQPQQHTASWQGQNVTLTATEFAMLHLFARQPTRVFSRDTIMGSAYDGNVYVSDRTIDSHIRHIRQKFAEKGCENIIETVHGVGYKLANCQ